jgi:hypothetical protein
VFGFLVAEKYNNTSIMITIEMNPYHVLEREIQHQRKKIVVQRNTSTQERSAIVRFP